MDTLDVNAYSEWGVIGNAGSGVFANWAANKYQIKMELDDKFGVLIHLHYYMNSKRKKIMDYRSGQVKPDEEIKSLFKI